LTNESAAKAHSGVLGGNNQDEQGCDASSGSDSGPRDSAARIEPACVKGEISGNEDLHIDGTVEGLVQLDERKLTVGATAKLTADVIAGEVIVYGSVNGNVHGKGKIEIKKDGSVNGDLTTAQIIIEDGAYFKGSIEIEKSAEKEGEKNPFSRPASAPATPAAGAGPRSI
jgi:cytoskeletal protein CcmA (bactofilin family)